MKPGVRLTLDFAIAVLIIAAVAVFASATPATPLGAVSRQSSIYAAIICVSLAGWLLVNTSGVLWLDFLLWPSRSSCTRRWRG